MLPPAFVEILSKLSHKIPNNCTWAIACGSALALVGVEYTPTDIDVFAPGEEASRIWGILADLPQLVTLHKHIEGGITSVWGRYVWQGIELDIVGDFSVRRAELDLSWDRSHPCWSNLAEVSLNGASVPVFCLEDLLLLYVALPGEETKLKKILATLHTRGPNREYLSILTGADTALSATVGRLMHESV
jgi:hypothetical protein